MAAPATFVVSLDFELNWGVRDQLRIEDYGANLHGVRAVIPRLLERFEAAGVHATWATVGMLFCESKEELIARLPKDRPAYADPVLSPYGHVQTVGANEREDPLHFAPSLVRAIADTPGQEVGTHTFSHYYCCEPVQTVEQFEDDLRAAVDVARDRGVAIRSIVFPRNQVDDAYLPICGRHGLTAYRGNPQAWMHSSRSAAGETPPRRAARLLDAYLPLPAPRSSAVAGRADDALVDVPATRFFRPFEPALAHLEPLKVRRMLGELERAARGGSLYHLWWHPHNFGVRQELHLAQLNAVLERFTQLRSEGRMRSLTMAALAEEQVQ